MCFFPIRSAGKWRNSAISAACLHRRQIDFRTWRGIFDSSIFEHFHARFDSFIWKEKILICQNRNPFDDKLIGKVLIRMQIWLNSTRFIKSIWGEGGGRGGDLVFELPVADWSFVIYARHTEIAIESFWD